MLLYTNLIMKKSFKMIADIHEANSESESRGKELQLISSANETKCLDKKSLTLTNGRRDESVSGKRVKL